MSEGHLPANYLIGFGASRTRFLLPHFILFLSLTFPSAGAVDKLVLPDGMQSVDFSYCEGLSGTAELGYE